MCASHAERNRFARRCGCRCVTLLRLRSISAVCRSTEPVVGLVGFKLPGDGLPHDLQRHPPGFNLDRREVDLIEHTIADQPLNLGLDFLRDRRVESPLFAGAAGLFASSCASHIRPLTSISSRTSPRSRWYSPIWARV